MPWVAGIDGCRAGWLVVLVWHDASGARQPLVKLCPTFADVLAMQPAPACMALDMPIGLLDQAQPGGRRCDRLARRLLGRRASSIFSPPARHLLSATRYEEVRRHGVSRQAFGILPKIREVDQLMTPAWQRVVYEAHPELAFLRLTGQPLLCNKKTPEGRRSRLRALGSLPGTAFRRSRATLAGVLQTSKRSQLAADDVIDAYVLAWTACRLVDGQATRLPEVSPVDAHGLRMEIWY